MLRQQIQTDQLTALKAHEKEKLEVLRYILAQIKNKEVDKKTELNDEETLEVIRKYVKQLNESIEAFEKGGRSDLAAASQAQKKVAEAYLPPQLTDQQLSEKISQLIAENQALIEKNPKAIIGIAMKELKNQADSSRIMAALKLNN